MYECWHMGGTEAPLYEWIRCCEGVACTPVGTSAGNRWAQARLLERALKPGRKRPGFSLPVAPGPAQTKMIWAPSDFVKKSIAVITSFTWGTRSSRVKPIISMAMWQA